MESEAGQAQAQAERRMDRNLRPRKGPQSSTPDGRHWQHEASPKA